MKRLIVGIAVAAMAFCAIGATLEENINAGDYAATVGQLSFSTNTLNYVKTAAQAAACYDAAVAATNYGAAHCAAHVALWYGDKATFERFLDLCASPAAEAAKAASSKGKGLSLLSAWGQSSFDPMATGRGKLKVLNIKGQEYFVSQSLNQLYPDMMLAWYKKLAAAGNWDLVSYAAWQANFTVDSAGRTATDKLAKWINADWKELLDSFTPERVEKLRYATSIAAVLHYALTKDYEAGDTERTEANRLMTPAVMKQYARQYLNGSYQLPLIEAKREAYAETMIQFCDDMMQKIYYAKRLDIWRKTKSNSKQLFPTVLASNDVKWNDKAAYALWIGDKDIILDTFLTIGTDASAENIANVIPVLNGLDVGYRSADVKQILATINKKYTLKLYDDRDTWEPILSKVRAMMEVVD